MHVEQTVISMVGLKCIGSSFKRQRHHVASAAAREQCCKSYLNLCKNCSVYRLLYKSDIVAGLFDGMAHFCDRENKRFVSPLFLPRDALRSAKDGTEIACRPSVCLSVCNVGGSGSRKWEILETNCG